MFRFTEARDSRETGGNPAHYISRWAASGSDSESYVRNYAFQATADAVSTMHGTVWRKDIRVKPVGYQLWKVEVYYDELKEISGQYSLSFDTSGGTVHITNSRETVRGWKVSGAAAGYTPANFEANDVPKHGGAIGVHGDQVDGVDIVIPALAITIDFQHPAGVISLAQIKNLARNTGKYNSDTFLTFAPGEVLLLGVVGREGSDIETSVSYKLACSEGVSDLSFGDELTGIEKKGWDVAWVMYQSVESGGKPARKPEFVYVERVYEPVAMATLLGFGGA